MPGTALRLRPHHILCLRFFEGRGYCEAFVNNAWAALRRLQAEGRFTVANGPDALCAACPNNENGVCRWQEKALRYDRAAARALGVRAGETYAFAAFAETDAKKLIPRVCADCEWYPVCSK